MILIARRDLDNGSSVDLVSLKNVVKTTEDCYKSHHKAAVIHGIWGDRRGRRPKGEEEDNDQIDARDNIDDRPERFLDLPRSPDKVTCAAREVVIGEHRVIGGQFTCIFDRSVPPPEEEEGASHEVAGVESAHGEGDHVVEGNR